MDITRGGAATSTSPTSPGLPEALLDVTCLAEVNGVCVETESS